MDGRIAILLLFTASVAVAFVSMNDEKRLTKHLIWNYASIGVVGRPVASASETWNVTFGLSLLGITDVDVKSQTVEVLMWHNMKWKDNCLTWNTADFKISSIRVRPSDIFLPDITLYNAASAPELVSPDVLAVVSSDGGVHYVPPIKQRFSCLISDQKNITCQMRFGSWTYNGFLLNLTMEAENADLSVYTPNPDWKLISTRASRNVVHYECCPEPYIDVTYELNLRKNDEK